MEVFCQSLLADVLAGALAGKDMATSRPRADLLLFSNQLGHEGGHGDAKGASFFHLLCGDVDRVFCDPRLLERSILTWSKH